MDFRLRRVLFYLARKRLIHSDGPELIYLRTLLLILLPFAYILALNTQVLVFKCLTFSNFRKWQWWEKSLEIWTGYHFSQKSSKSIKSLISSIWLSAPSHTFQKLNMTFHRNSCGLECSVNCPCIFEVTKMFNHL